MNLLLKRLKLENISDAIKIVNSAELIFPYHLTFNFFTFFRHVKVYNISFEHSFIGYHDGRAVGAMLNCGNARKGEDLFTYVWAIAPHVAGTRIASDLTRFALDHVKKRNFKRVICEVVHDSDQTLWQKLGFRKTRELHSMRLNALPEDLPEELNETGEVELRECEMADIEGHLTRFHNSEPPWVKRPEQLGSYQQELKKYLIMEQGGVAGYLLISQTESFTVINELRFARTALGRGALKQLAALTAGKPLISFYVPEEDYLYAFYRDCGFESFLVHDELQLVFESSCPLD